MTDLRAPLVPEPDETRSLPQARHRRTPDSSRRERTPNSPLAAGSESGGPGRGRGERGGVGAQPPQYLDTHRNISKTLKRLRKLYLAHDLTAILRQCDRDGEAGRIEQCGLYFRGYISDCGSERLRPIVCGHTLCPRCQRARSKPLQNRVYGIIRTRSEVDYRFLTLTVENVPRIDREYINWLIDCFRQLRSNQLWSQVSYNCTEKKWACVSGGFYSIDTTYNAAAKSWHVHLHVIVEFTGLARRRSQKGKTQGGWVPGKWLAQLKAEWFRITAGSHVIHIGRVNDRAVKELVKYAAKLVTFIAQPELVDEYLRAFFNVRRVQGFGSFLGVEIEPPHPWRCKCGKCKWENWHPFGLFGLQQIEFVEGEPRLKRQETGPPVDVGPPSGPWEFPLSKPNYQEAMV